MHRLHWTILQELARLETATERKKAVGEILELLEEFIDTKLVMVEEDGGEIPGANPFEWQTLWSR